MSTSCDVVCSRVCMASQEQEMAQKGYLSRFVSEVYAPLLMNKIVKAVVLVSYFAMLVSTSDD